MTTAPTQVRVETMAPRVLRITLDRPPVNAADMGLLTELYQVLASVRDRDVDVVVLTGAGGQFCPGNDIYEFEAMDSTYAAELMYAVRRAFWALYDCPVPTIARVNGAAYGTGIALAGLCDLVVAAESATFGLPELNVGVLGGLKFARRFVPELAVRRMFFTSEPVTARTFADWGAPIEVVADGDLDDAVARLATTVAAKGGLALRMAKQAMNAVEHLDIKTGYEYEQTFTIRMADRPEAKAAVRSVIADIGARRQRRPGP
jgi:enoyl-CoA hydratase